MLRIFGAHGLPINDSEQLLGRFNDHLEHGCFVLVEEALFAPDGRVADKIKARLTANTVLIEPKGHPQRTVPNRLSAMLVTNHEWAVPAGENARRWWVVSVSEERADRTAENRAYFDRLHDDLERGGDGQFLNYLQKYDLKGWHPRQMRVTAETAEQQLATLRGIPRWALSCVAAGRLVAGSGYNGPLPDLGGDIESSTCRDAFISWARAHGERAQDERALGKAFQHIFGPYKKVGGRAGRRRIYSVPSGPELRREIYKKLHIPNIELPDAGAEDDDGAEDRRE